MFVTAISPVMGPMASPRAMVIDPDEPHILPTPEARYDFWLVGEGNANTGIVPPWLQGHSNN